MTTVSHFRGHLFADLRGYTAFIEKAGNAAGAELVQRFRQLIRDEVGAHAGAEIKTEGDAIYVVFPSASTALMCGLALVEKAAQHSAANPDMPIRMGVGVHAGEAVEVPEGGYVGSAVNLAARVCAVAEPGQVWVTGTVRGIAQASVPVAFIPKGRRRLKGIDEPVELFQVLPAGTAVPIKSRVPRRMALGGAGVLGLGAAIVLAFLLWPGGTPTPTPSAVPEATSQLLRIGPLDIGEYASDSFTPAFSLAVSDPGWALTAQRAASADFLHQDQPSGRVAIARLTGVNDNPCNPDGTYPISTGSTPEDLMAALREVWFLEVGEQSPIQIDRRAGLRVDFRITDGVFAACDLGANEVPLFPLGSGTFGAQPGDSLRLEAVPVNGQTVSFISSTIGGLDVPVTQVEAFRDIAGNLIDGIRFR